LKSSKNRSFTLPSYAPNGNLGMAPIHPTGDWIPTPLNVRIFF
jgi:hypothetical protein